MSGGVGEAQVKLRNGTALTLYFDHDAIVRAERAVAGGGTFFEMLGRMEADADGNEVRHPPSLESVTALAYGGLRKHHADFTLEKLKTLVLTNLQAFTTAVLAGVGSAFGEDLGLEVPAEDDDDEEGGAANAKTDPPRGGGKTATTPGAV